MFIFLKTAQSAPEILHESAEQIQQNAYYDAAFLLRELTTEEEQLVKDENQAKEYRIDEKAKTCEILPKPKTLAQWQAEKIQEATDYGNSEHVDAVFLGELKVVFSALLRMKLQERFRIEEAEGKTTTSLKFQGVTLELPIPAVRTILDSIAARAIANFDTTQEHVNKIKEITDAKAVAAYDVTQGYPPALRFPLPS